jgi:hypothetical protein
MSILDEEIDSLPQQKPEAKGRLLRLRERMYATNKAACAVWNNAGAFTRFAITHSFFDVERGDGKEIHHTYILSKDGNQGLTVHYRVTTTIVHDAYDALPPTIDVVFYMMNAGINSFLRSLWPNDTCSVLQVIKAGTLPDWRPLTAKGAPDA